MGTFQRPNRLFFLAIIGLSTILAACSSGGGSSGKAANDTRPDPFTLIAPTGVDLEEVAFDTPIVSDPVTIKGIDTAAPVSIEGGEYAIGDGEFTNAPGTVRNGQNVRVRVQSPIKAEQTATATLNIGGVTESFTVTTGPDTIPPEVTILFPPPASMTEGQTLFMRGTVKDANGTLEGGAVTVNGVEAKLELNETKDEGTWSVEVDLVLGEENTAKVIAFDVAGNGTDDESAKSVMSYRVASIVDESFPGDDIPFIEPVSLDIFADGTYALVADPSLKSIIAVSLQTGERQVFSDNNLQADNALIYPWTVHIGENDRVYIFDWDIQKPTIYETDELGTREVFIEKNSENPLDQPYGLYLSKNVEGESLYVADGGALFKFDRETKSKTVISDSNNNIPSADNPITGAVGIINDKGRGAFVVIDVAGVQRLYSVDAKTGARLPIEIDETLHIAYGAMLTDRRSLILVETNRNKISIAEIESGNIKIISPSSVNDINALAEPRSVAVHPGGQYVLIVDRLLKSVVALDIESQKKVVVSKSK